VSVIYVAAAEAPGDLVAEAGEREVRLRWCAPARLLDGGAAPETLAYEVLRAPSPDAAATPLTRTPPGQLALADRNVENDHTYFYAIRALRVDRIVVGVIVLHISVGQRQLSRRRARQGSRRGVGRRRAQGFVREGLRRGAPVEQPGRGAPAQAHLALTGLGDEIAGRLGGGHVNHGDSRRGRTDAAVRIAGDEHVRVAPTVGEVPAIGV